MKFKFSPNNFFNWILVIIFIFLSYLLLEHPMSTWTSDVQNQNLQNKKISHIKIAGKILKIEIVSTKEELEKGLSGRKYLEPEEGMLFVFNHTAQYPFWMKEMNFPLDIIWIGGDLKVVYIKKNASPKSYPESFSPKEDALYVLEVNSSFSEKNNLKEGDKVEFLSS